MGVVYRAEDLTLRRQVAIKIFPAFFTASQDDRKRFFQEARLASSLNHPNIVTVHEFNEVEGTAFIVSECVEGKTLGQLLHEGPLAISDAMRIAIEIASGISEAHKKGIVHRDIKPENIMIAQSGHIKVMDFGLARLMGSSHVTSPGSLIGTFAYMSPEQIDEGEVDARSDIFSMGTVLYQMATGTHPFHGKTVAELLSSIARKTPEQLKKYCKDIPGEFERIVLKALQKDRRWRYQTIDEMKDDLARLAANPTMKRKFDRTALQALRRPAIVLSLPALLVTGYMLWNFLKPASTASTPFKAIAVLPFVNMSDDPRDAYLSIGLADDIITRLSSIRALLVKSMSAVTQYQGKNVAATDVGKDLGAEYVLEGRYARHGDSIEVSVQVVDVHTGNVICADQVDRPSRDIRTIHEEITSHIINAMRLTITSDELSNIHKVRSKSSEAFDQYLHGVVATIADSRENNESAITRFERALQLDSTFADAAAALSMAYTERFWSSYSPDTTWVGKGEEVARHAIRLEPGLAGGHTAHAFALRVKGRYSEAMREVVNALSIDPHSSFSLEDLSEFYRNLGDFTKAHIFAERAAESDPSFNIFRVRARLFQFEGKYRASIPELEHAILRSPSDSWLRGSLLADSYIHLGELDKAEQEIQLAESMDTSKPETHITRAMLYTERGESNKAEEQLRAVQSFIERDYASAYYAAGIYARQGKRDQTIAAMERSIQLGNRWYSWYKDSWFDALRADARYQSLLAKLKGELDSIKVEIERANL
ncbi:MAG: protein kinase [Ignavibacteriae bacterium]|nr:protein kinase [Ignavibacteriota bacterium]